MFSIINSLYLNPFPRINTLNQWVAYYFGEFINRGFLWMFLDRKWGPLDNCGTKWLWETRDVISRWYICKLPVPVAARLLRSWVRIPSGAWMFVCCECCVLSGRGLCDELITRPEESYRLWCVVVCDLETSRMRRPWPALGRSATEKIVNWFDGHLAEREVM
jgi:hypothetical protein